MECLRCPDKRFNPARNGLAGSSIPLNRATCVLFIAVSLVLWIEWAIPQEEMAEAFDVNCFCLLVIFVTVCSEKERNGGFNIKVNRQSCKPCMSTLKHSSGVAAAFWGMPRYSLSDSQNMPQGMFCPT